MNPAGAHSSQDRSPLFNSRNVNISTVIAENQTNHHFVLNKSLTMENHDENFQHKRSHIHFNRLWSVWYAVIITFLQGYLVVQGLRNYVDGSLLHWRNGFPATELSMQLIFCALTLLFLPLFLVSALFKVGNLANDGVKLSARKTTCSSDPTSLFNDETNSSTMKALWMHGVPISVFIHIITALCLLLPHLLLEAKLIQNQILPKENLWRSEMDFIFHNNDRVVVLEFSNTSPKRNTSGFDENANNGNFDDNIEEFDYDPFETHDSLKTPASDLTKHSGKSKEVFKIPKENFDIDDDLDDFDDDDEDESNESESREEDESYKLNKEYELSPDIFTTSTSTVATTQRIVVTEALTSTEAPFNYEIQTTETTRKTIPTTTETHTTEGLSSTWQDEDFLTQEEVPLSTKSTTISSIDDWFWSTPEHRPTVTGSTLSPSTSTSTTTMPTTTTSTSTSSTTTTTTTTLAPTTTSTTTQSSTTTTTTEIPVSSTVKMNKAHKTRKHHKKHQQNHAKETKVIDENPEFKVEDFDDLHPEIEMKLGEKSTTTSNNGKRKQKNSQGRQQNNARNKSSSAQQGPDLDSSETSYPIQKPKQARGKQKNSEIINLKKETSTKSATISSSYGEYSDFVERKRMKMKRSAEYDNNDEDDKIKDSNLPENASPSVDEDEFILRDENGNRIIPVQLLHHVSSNNYSNSVEFDRINQFLISIVGKNEKFDPKAIYTSSPSLEYINLAIALLVWSTRYPSVFWESSKAFTLIFSFQLLANSLDILVLYAGTGILFKVQTVGEFMTVNNHSSPLLLNGIVTLALTLLAFLLTILSSMILYLYGHSRLAAKIRDCKTITLKESDVWSYFSHCASLCFILALAVVKAPIIHDLVVSYRISLDRKLLYATIISIVHLFLWIFIWMALTAKRRWTFKLPILVETMQQTRNELIQPLVSPTTRISLNSSPLNKDEETVYWPSGKIKVSFDNRMSDKLNDHNSIEYHGSRSIISAISPHNAGETDEGEYATLKNNIAGSGHNKIHFSEYDEVINIKTIPNNESYDNTSEEGKLLACVHSESVTYASTRIIEPPKINTCSTKIYESYMGPRHGASVLAPVAVQVEHQRILRRGDSGMPQNEALTPKSDTNSTESSASPPERALSESSSGVHSGEDSKEEVLIRSRPLGGTLQRNVKPPPAVIEEEPYGRITANMKMSSFKDSQSSCNTLPMNRGSMIEVDRLQPAIMDYPCNTMPAMQNLNNHYSRGPSAAVDMKHTTLPNNIRYSTGGETHYMKQMSQMKNNGSPYASVSGPSNGHHSFSSRYIQREPLPPPPQSPPQNMSSAVGNMNQVNNAPPPAGLIGINRSYQMVLNEMCANNQTTSPPQFPPPPPSIAN